MVIHQYAIFGMPMSKNKDDFDYTQIYGKPYNLACLFIIYEILFILLRKVIFQQRHYSRKLIYENEKYCVLTETDT